MSLQDMVLNNRRKSENQIPLDKSNDEKKPENIKDQNSLNHNAIEIGKKYIEKYEPNKLESVWIRDEPTVQSENCLEDNNFQVNKNTGYETLSVLNFQEQFMSICEDDILQEESFIESWSVDKQIEFIKKLEQPKEIPILFRSQDITGKAFIKMTEDDLKDQGISKKGHTITLRNAIEKQK